MEIWQYIAILRHPDTLFFSKKNIEKKINALTRVAIEGHPNDISSLTDFLKDRNREIRGAVCRAVIHLFKKIDNQKQEYDTLKYCRISESDIDFYEDNFPTDQFIELMAISSLNGNGYTREKAVKKLSGSSNPRAIQFLIYRLADWVLPVRQAALKGLEGYKSIKYIDCLIEKLPVFNWLQKVERIDLGCIYNDIIEFITVANRDYVLARFRTYPDKIRILLARHISNSLVNYPIELELLLSDKHFLIRSLTVDHFDKLAHNKIDHLLNDKSAKIRQQTLYRLKGAKEFENIVRNYLADNSSAIRHFARFSLKEAGIDFSEFYHQNLKNNKQINGSLSGLADVNAKHYSGTIKQYLHDSKPKVRKTAFLALRKLDEESAYEFSVANLDTSSAGLRNTIIDHLITAYRQDALEKARACYHTGDHDLKRSMIKLFGKIGGWAVIPDLMIGTIDENEDIRQLSFDYLKIWKTKAIRLFTTPKQGETERAKQIFGFAFEVHEHKQYFERNPLEGLDFFFG